MSFTSIILLCFSWIFLITNTISASLSQEKPLVLVTIAPYGHLVKKIAGETVDVASIVPPGVNLHIYEPTIRELERAQRASVWFQVGEAFETRVGKTLQEKNPKLTLSALWKMVPLLEEGSKCQCAHHEMQDRHIWTSPRLVLVQCRQMAEILSALQPQYESLYKKNLETLEQELQQLDAELRHLLTPLSGSALLVSHPAFAYFCKDYDLIQLSVESSGRDPLPRDVEEILKKAQQYEVQAVFTQKGYNNKGAELIAQKLELPIFSVDPYAKDYEENLRQIVRLIVEHRR
jgi:zinc transport system substrate-binding protein